MVESNSSSLRTTTIFLISLLLPVAYVLVYFLNSEYYPVRIEGYYLNQALFLYNRLISGDLYNFFYEILFFKSFAKPSLVAILPVPFLLLTGGKVLYAVYLYQIFFLTVFHLLVFGYFKDKVSAGIAAICSILVAFLPWVLWSASNFSTELAYLTFASGFVAYGSKSADSFQQKNFVLSCVFLALMFCTRQAETCIMVAPTVLFLIIKFCKSSELRRRLRWGIAVFFLLAGFWIIPKYDLLIGWISYSTYGFSTRVQSLRPFMSNLEWLYEYYLKSMGVLPPLLFLGAVFLNRRKVRSDAAIYFAVLSCLLSILLAGIFSNNDVTRFYYVSWMVLCLFSLRTIAEAWTLKPYYKFSAAALLAGLLIYNFAAFDFGNAAGLDREDKAAWSIFGQRLTDMRIKKQDELKPFVEKLIEMKYLPTGGANVSVFLPTRPRAHRFEPFILSLIAADLKYSWNFQQWYCYHCSTENITEQIEKNSDYLIIGPTDGPWFKQEFNSDLVAESLLQLCTEADDRSTVQFLQNYEFVGKVEFTHHFTDKENYCLLRNLRRSSKAEK